MLFIDSLPHSLFPVRRSSHPSLHPPSGTTDVAVSRKVDLIEWFSKESKQVARVRKHVNEETHENSRVRWCQVSSVGRDRTDRRPRVAAGRRRDQSDTMVGTAGPKSTRDSSGRRSAVLPDVGTFRPEPIPTTQEPLRKCCRFVCQKLGTIETSSTKNFRTNNILWKPHCPWVTKWQVLKISIAATNKNLSISSYIFCQSVLQICLDKYRSFPRKNLELAQNIRWKYF